MPSLDQLWFIQLTTIAMFEQQAEPKSQQGMWQLSLDYVYRGMVARSVHASKNDVKEMLWNMQRPEKNADISR